MAKNDLEILKEFINDKEAQEKFNAIKNSVMDFNIFEITGLGNQEIKHSNTLVWLFGDNEHGLKYQILEKFLDSYKTAGEFFEDIYGIDEIFVSELIESGKSPIINIEDYCNYMKLACKYWELRLKQKKIKNYLVSSMIKTYQDRLKIILNEIEILENSINKQ